MCRIFSTLCAAPLDGAIDIARPKKTANRTQCPAVCPPIEFCPLPSRRFDHPLSRSFLPHAATSRGIPITGRTTRLRNGVFCETAEHYSDRATVRFRPGTSQQIPSPANPMSPYAVCDRCRSAQVRTQPECEFRATEMCESVRHPMRQTVGAKTVLSAASPAMISAELRKT